MTDQITKNACPFCGLHSTQLLTSKTNPTSTDKIGYQIQCTSCGARGPQRLPIPRYAGRAWDIGGHSYKRPFIEAVEDSIFPAHRTHLTS